MLRSVLSHAPACLVVAACLASASAAAAHAHLVSSDPAAGATVAGMKTVTLHMSETLEPKFSGLGLARADGAAVVAKVGVPEADRKTIVAEMATPLTPGAYRLNWHAVSADGHRTKGEFSFKVR